MEDQPVLLGSTFPLSLIRRAVQIVPAEIEQLKKILRCRRLVSFWGHDNTLACAGELLQADIIPETERPALSLTTEGFPTLDGQIFKDCWILSPDYVPGFRPQIGSEVDENQIRDWQVLYISWDEDAFLNKWI